MNHNQQCDESDFFNSLLDRIAGRRVRFRPNTPPPAPPPTPPSPELEVDPDPVSDADDVDDAEDDNSSRREEEGVDPDPDSGLDDAEDDEGRGVQDDADSNPSPNPARRIKRSRRQFAVFAGIGLLILVGTISWISNSVVPTATAPASDLQIPIEQAWAENTPQPIQVVWPQFRDKWPHRIAGLGTNGRVTLSFIIDETGSAKNVVFKGYQDFSMWLVPPGGPLIDEIRREWTESAQQALAHWRFNPQRRGAQVVERPEIINFDFSGSNWTVWANFAGTAVSASAQDVTQSPTFKASFDCVRASRWTEKQVCSTSYLAEADLKLKELYDDRMEGASVDDASTLRETQRSWLNERNGCEDIRCLEKSYSTRISELEVFHSYCGGLSGVPCASEHVTSPATEKSEAEYRAFRLSDNISYTQLSMQDATARSFPLTYLKGEIGRVLGDYETTAVPIRVGATFIEPSQFRAQAKQSMIIGYLVLSLPGTGDCTKKFGEVSTYYAGTPEQGIKQAIDRQAGAIARWLQLATANGGVGYPSGCRLD